MVHQDDGHHRLGDRRRADADAGVVAAVDHHLGGLPAQVHGAFREPDARGGLQGDADDDVLARGDPPEDPSGAIGQEAPGRDGVAVLGALLLDAREARTDLDPLHRVDAHQRMGQVGVQTVEHGLSEARRDSGGHHRHPGAHRVARLAQGVHVGLQLRDLARVGKEEGVLLHRLPVEALGADGTQLGDVAAHAHAEPLPEILLRDRPGRHPRGRLPRGRPPAAPVVPQAVLLLVRVIGVAGTEQLRDIPVVPGALVDVLDEQPDGRARGPPLEDAGEDPDLVRLPALGRVPALSRAPAVQVPLQVRLAQLEPRRAAVHDGADRGAVALAEGSDGEKPADGVPGQRVR